MWGNRRFDGMLPKVSERLLPENAAQVARNCWLDKGYPRPVADLVNVAHPAFPANTQTIYRYDTDRWFAWAGDVDIVRAPAVGDAVRRVIWTGDGAPRHTSTVIMQGAGFVSPGRPLSRNLGIPAPDQAPVTALLDFEADDTRIAETHAYVFTFLSDLDEEGPPSPPTGTVTRTFDSEGNIRPVTVTMTAAAPGNRGITRKRIYRTATSSAGVTTWRLLATVPLATANYTDRTLTAALGDELISTNWDPPPAGLTGLIALPNGVLAGFVGRDVYFSQPFQPHAWPADYVQPVDSDIVGLGNFGVDVVVGTTGSPFLITGGDPSTAVAAGMEFDQPCAAKRSFATVAEQGIVYASHEGLVRVGPGGGQFLSREAYDGDDWEKLNPDEFRAVYHDGLYLAFSRTKATALGPAQNGVVEIDDAGVKAVWRDGERDKLYVVDGDNLLKEWKTSVAATDAPRSMTWRSRLHTGRLRTWPAAQVIADAYPVTLKLFAGGAEVHSQEVADNIPFRLPPLGMHADWEYEISGTNAAHEVRIGSMQDLLGG